jgi:protein MAK16
MCNRHSCPLANGRYATVMEHKGHCFLYMKTIERAHLPNQLWEKIRLPKNYKQALALIDENLEFWGKFQRHKCKQRLTKLHQMIIRQRKLRISDMHTQEKLVTINKKYEKRETRREAGAEKAAQLERAIEKELLTRLKSGTFYPQEIYNLNPKVFNEALEGQVVEEEEDDVEYEVDEDEMDEELEEELDDEELQRLEDEESKDGDESDSVEDLGDSIGQQGAKKMAGAKRPRVKIGYEEEAEEELEYEFEDGPRVKKVAEKQTAGFGDAVKKRLKMTAGSK